MGQRRKIAGSRILITGASQGIGRAIAELASAKGSQVLAAARSIDLLAQLEKQLKSRSQVLRTVQADVTSASDREKMVAAAQEYFGGLDILINNARAFLPLLKKGNRPAIVNISSIAGKRGIPARSEYSASKFAVQGFSEALRAELSKDGIDVLVVCPSLTQTNFSQNMLEQKALMQMDHMRGMTAEQVAAATLRSIERGRNEVTLSFGGKLLVLVCRFLPRLADRIARRKVLSLFQDEIAARKQKKTESVASHV
jgi:short-subunit dehydrogenase